MHYLRTLADARSLREALLGASDVVVVGAGFIGLEVASTAASMGVRTTVLEAAPTPLTRVLGPGVGEALVAMHRGEGTEVLCGCVIVDRNEHGVVLSDGSTIPADIVVVGVGAVPNVDWLDGSGVQVDDGVVCGGDGRSSRAGVWAVGDAARWPNAVTGQHLRVEQWQSAREQANVVAHNLVGRDAVWDSVPYFWSDQCGRKIQFAGRVGADVDIRNDARGPVAVFGDEDTLVGALVTSNPRLLAELRKRIARRDAWSTAHEALS